MEMHCKTERELGEALKSGEDTIYVEGRLGKAVIVIKATGKIAWAVCAISLTVAILSYMATVPTVAINPPAAGAKALLGTISVGASATVLGNATVAAVLIGVAAGGIGGLTTLRDRYKIAEKNDNYLVLKRK